MEEKKLYEKPSMKVHELRQRARLLVGSDGQAGVRSYNWNNESEE